MNKDKIITILQNNNLKSFIQTNDFKKIKVYIDKYITFTTNSSEQCYSLLNGITEKPLCIYCNNIKTFYSSTKGYSNTCGSKACAAKYSYEIHPELKEVHKHRALGKKHSQKTKDLQSKNAKIFNADPKKIEKTRLAVKDKYGVDNVFQLEETKRKAKDTCLKKYGVEHASKRESHRNNMICWMTNGFKDLMISKYGVSNSQQVPEFFDKTQISKSKIKFRTYEYIFESGRVSLIQGYENKAIDKLLVTYDERELITDTILKPVIEYSYDGVVRKYYCDIWIPKDNLIIEVKSEYTMLAEFEKNLFKAVATKKAGYNFKLMVF